jgi:hypothetical protein
MFSHDGKRQCWVVECADVDGCAELGSISQCCIADMSKMLTIQLSIVGVCSVAQRRVSP